LGGGPGESSTRGKGKISPHRGIRKQGKEDIPPVEGGGKIRLTDGEKSPVAVTGRLVEDSCKKGGVYAEDALSRGREGNLLYWSGRRGET